MQQSSTAAGSSSHGRPFIGPRARLFLVVCVLYIVLQVQERRATRGLAAAARLQGQYRNAIKHLERVLEISQQMREYTGGCTT